MFWCKYARRKNAKWWYLSTNVLKPCLIFSRIKTQRFCSLLGPNTPVNLSISHISPNKLTLHWQNPPQHPAFDVHCFWVYKRESIHLMSGLDEYRICDVSNELILTSLIPGRQYTLYMRSEDSVYGLHSDVSNAISATTYPSSRSFSYIILNGFCYIRTRINEW